MVAALANVKSPSSPEKPRTAVAPSSLWRFIGKEGKKTIASRERRDRSRRITRTIPGEQYLDTTILYAETGRRYHCQQLVGQAPRSAFYKLAHLCEPSLLSLSRNYCESTCRVPATIRWFCVQKNTSW